jgi:hypothetical protein
MEAGIVDAQGQDRYLSTLHLPPCNTGKGAKPSVRQITASE